MGFSHLQPILNLFKGRNPSLLINNPLRPKLTSINHFPISPTASYYVFSYFKLEPPNMWMSYALYALITTST